MLLRRVIEHVKAQNWTAVALDFLIVVVGVFIGIQVANWNEARALSQEEREIVLRLLDEAKETAREIDERIDGNDALRASAVRAYETLKLGAVDQATADQLRTDLSMLGGWRDEGYVRATLDQIVNSGKLSLIRSQSLKDNIAAHLEVLASSANTFQNLGNMNLDTMTAMNQRLSFSFDDRAWEITTPANELLSDQELERLVGHFSVVYTLMATGHRTTVKRNEAYLAALEAYAQERGWLE